MAATGSKDLWSSRRRWPRAWRRQLWELCAHVNSQYSYLVVLLLCATDGYYPEAAWLPASLELRCR